MTKINTQRELTQLCNRNRDGSFSTQAARRDILSLAGRQLVELGIYNLPATGLKQKHVLKLLERWKADGLSDATLKNRMSHVRWWAEKIGKQNLVPRTNAELGIGRRKYVTNNTKAVQVGADALIGVKDERVRMSLELQGAFGLRREESIKFQPQFAMGAGPDKILLKATWCKGGRAREIPVRTAYQRDLLARAAILAGTGSLIPENQSYKDQLKRYENTTSRAGLSKLHGLRHEYAQQRYRELTSWEPPVGGGPKSRQLTPEMKVIDRAARLTISEELGHSREAITAVYLGR
jgi:site-specific recombinase XerC